MDYFGSTKRRKRRRRSSRAGMRNLNIRPGALSDTKKSAPLTGHFFDLLPKKKKKKPHGPMFPGGLRDPVTAPTRSPSRNRKRNEELLKRIKKARETTRGGRRKTRRKRRQRRTRRKRRKRRTRKNGGSPLHIRRRLLALAAKLKRLKNKRKRHKDAKALAEYEKKRSAFGKIPKGTNE